MPQFISPGAAAGNAIQQFLLQREAENHQRLQAELQAQQQAEESALRQREMALREQDMQRRAAQDTAAAEARATAQRAAQNQVGVRGMMADAMGQGPLTPESAKTIGIMAFREGMEAPDQVQQALTPPKRTIVQTVGPDGTPIRKAVTEDELIAGVPEYQEPDMPDGGAWQSAGNGMLFNTRTGEFRQGPQAPSADAGSQYATDTADRVIAAIDEVLPKITSTTAGVLGSLGAKTGLYQPAVDVNAELQTVAGNIAFNALQQMRNASKTGGALGSIAQQELQLLQSVEGSLRQDQSPANLKAQLAKVRASMERFKQAQQRMSAAGGGRATGAGPGPQAPTTARRVGRFEIVSEP